MIDHALTVAVKLDPWTLRYNELAKYFVVAVSFGGGLNSTALLVRWVKEGYPPPHRITFADTGSERQETYDHVSRFSEWLVSQGMPAILITRKGGRVETLEQYCLRTKHLPALAYGGKSCSLKFKVEPQERDINRWPEAKAAWAAGSKVVKIIGYGAEEQKRITKAKLEDDKYFYRFPLDEWGVFRDDCTREVASVGLPPPPKSSCFFCPSSTKAEILALPPELKTRAIIMESVSMTAGNSRTTKGLGRRFAWTDFLAGADVPEPMAAVCMSCNDGSAE